MSDSVASAKPVVPVVVGPTAVGKTALALQLVDRLNLEIVSCDSRQIYRRMNIGTAKPTPSELAGRPYHLIDYVEPSVVYSAARYRDDAEQSLQSILNAGKIPLMVCGTGLYLRALESGFFATPNPDVTYRASLAQLTTSELHTQLEKVDPSAAESIPMNNRERVIRALEINKLTGKTKSELSSDGDYPVTRYTFRYFLLNRSREKLYKIINFRVDKMIGDGLIDEVDQLRVDGFGQSLVLNRTLGYREVLDLLEGRVQRERCLELIKQRTRNYAKRQLTWFRHQIDAEEIDLESPNGREKLLSSLDKLNLDRKLC